jgi:Arylsulfotransferase (ASST)
MSIFDTSLALVKQVRAQHGVANLDQHETHLSRNNRAALVTSYNPEHYDLSAQNITTGQGWIQNSLFQRINIETGDLMFEWTPIEHVALSEGFVLPNSTEVVGSGLSATSPWVSHT